MRKLRAQVFGDLVLEQFDMPEFDHNLTVGPIVRCQVCGSEDLKSVIDLGHQPLCDSLLTSDQLDEPEDYYPLRLVRCADCSLGQIDYAVDGSIVYHPGYPYRSGITKELAEHLHSLAADVVREYELSKDSLVVDIGSNDGTLLTGFSDRGMRVLGVEPTNVAKIAIANGIDSIQEFFSESVANEIAAQHGRASAITATNVFAHMTGLGDVMRGIDALLDDGGVFVAEVHYLLNIIQGFQYDTIYHEHLRSYSLKSLVRLFEQYNFTVVDARVVGRYGGSLRVCAVKGRAPVEPTVRRMLDAEQAFGLYDQAVYDGFRENSMRAGESLLRLALDAKERGQTFVANSCPGRGSTLVNYTGLTRDLMPYICEQPTSLKLGLHLPGKHIPIVENSRLIEEQPDYVLLLAWHYADAIAKELRGRGLKSRLVIPLPEVRVLDV